MTSPPRVAVVGLGYVGLEVAKAFGRDHPTTGYDIDEARLDDLDANGDGDDLHLTSDPDDLAGHDAYIVTVPTPVDDANSPDLRALKAASRDVGEAIAETVDEASAPPLVVYESTTYPGCTEEECRPVLEEASGLEAGDGFLLAYSPERINPGDDEHTIETVTKVVGGRSPAARKRARALYDRVVDADIHLTPDLETAEAAKVIENVQRDLNIALMNELSILFDEIDLDTQAVLDAAGTKWNFLDFHPGLVGGHCIPVDPYYLTHKAEEAGYHPDVILAGRRINDGMGRYVAQATIKQLIDAGRTVQGSRVLVLGASFKPDVGDVRNTRIVDLVEELEEHGVEVEVDDPVVPDDELDELGFTLAPDEPGERAGRYQGVVVAVPHGEFQEKGSKHLADHLPESGGIVVDVQGVLDASSIQAQGHLYWSL